MPLDAMARQVAEQADTEVPRDVLPAAADFLGAAWTAVIRRPVALALFMVVLGEQVPIRPNPTAGLGVAVQVHPPMAMVAAVVAILAVAEVPGTMLRLETVAVVDPTMPEPVSQTQADTTAETDMWSLRICEERWNLFPLQNRSDFYLSDHSK